MSRWITTISAAMGALFVLSLIFGYGDARVSISPRTVLPVKAGWFIMGSDKNDLAAATVLCARQNPDKNGCAIGLFKNEGPAHRVYLSAFQIDRTEVSNQDYERCVLANACAPSRLSDGDKTVAAPNLPVAGVTWAEAERYCHWVGGKLPTEAQWERAARGVTQRRFPWGSFYNSHLANHGSIDMKSDKSDGYEFAAPVDAFIDGEGLFGLLNMAGNVSEFTADVYAARYDEKANRVDPTGPATGDGRVIRGGSWRRPIYALRTTYRAKIGEFESQPDVGFRCAY